MACLGEHPRKRISPAPLIFEAELALAKAQLKTQTPPLPATPIPEPPKARGESPDNTHRQRYPRQCAGRGLEQSVRSPESANGNPGVQPLQYSATADTAATNGTVHANGTGLPPDWPDPRGFIPPPPRSEPPPSVPSDAPVLRHTRTYNGNDMEFTTALSSYYAFRDDARFGGWQSYLNRSDDFIRFCCHMHISEMLTARGGAGESRLVWRQPNIR